MGMSHHQSGLHFRIMEREGNDSCTSTIPCKYSFFVLIFRKKFLKFKLLYFRKIIFMTLIQFKKAASPPEGHEFYEFSSKILSSFHGFQVSDQTAGLYNQKRENSDLGLFSLFSQNVWNKFFSYIEPRALFKMVVATRNMNGMIPIDQLRNSYIFLRTQVSISNFAGHLVAISNYNGLSRFYFPERKPVVFNFISIESDHTLNLGQIGKAICPHTASDPVSVQCRSPNRVDMLGVGFWLDVSYNVTTYSRLASVKKLHLYNSHLNYFAFLRSIMVMPQLESLSLENCMFEHISLLPLPDYDKLENLTTLNLKDLSIPVRYLSDFFKIAPNIKVLAVPDYHQGPEEEAFFDLLPSHLDKVEELEIKEHVLNDRLISILKAAPCLKTLKLPYTDLKITMDCEGLSFPTVTRLYVPQANVELVKMYQLMPNVTELDIWFDDFDILSSLKPNPKITKLFYNTRQKLCTEKVLQDILRLFPMLENLVLEFDRENDNFEEYQEYVQKYCEWAAKGYELIQRSIETHMCAFPTERAYIEGVLAVKIEEHRKALADAEDDMKRAHEDGSDSSAKRRKVSDD